MVKTLSNLKGSRVGAKAPRKMPVSSCNTSGSSSKKYSGCNSYCPRETPIWQKEITKFFPPKTPTETDKPSVSTELPSSSSSSKE